MDLDRFSIVMARMVGDEGRVIAIDFQEMMLDVLHRRTERAGVADRTRLHKCVLMPRPRAP